MYSVSQCWEAAQLLQTNFSLSQVCDNYEWPAGPSCCLPLKSVSEGESCSEAGSCSQQQLSAIFTYHKIISTSDIPIILLEYAH